MTKVALLIRVADPNRDLQPGTANEVAALQQLLSAMGEFIEVKALNNPEPVAMQQAIEALFSDRHPGDLVLLYFSGQTLVDDRGKLYWATRATCQAAQGKLVKSTAVATDFLQDVMNDSRAQQQVVILDCWLGGIKAEVQSAIAAGHEQLGGPRRVILTAANATQNGREQQRADRSTYTDYLVEGLETGVADLDQDGVVSLNELHHYSRRKLQISAPAIQPEIYPAAPDNLIQIAKVPGGDSQLRYRQEVERCAKGGISIVSRSILELLKDQLGLAPEATTIIEAQVLKPYQVYQRNLQRYAQAVVKAIHQQDPLPAEARDRLNRVQQVLGLRNQDTALIEAQAYQAKVAQSGLKIPPPPKSLQDHSTPEGTTSTIDSPSIVDLASQRTTPGLVTTTRQATGQNRWLLIAAIAALVLGMGYGWRQWQVTRQLRSLQALAAVRDYQSCLEVGTTSARNPQKQKLLQQCQAGANWQNVQVQSFSGHLDSIWSVAINPDGQTLASGSDDATIKLWSMDGRLLRTLRGHASEVLSVAISPDGQTLASGSWDKTVKIWHLPTGRLLHTLSGHSHEVWSVAISPDGQTLASGSNDRTIKLWSGRGRLLRTLRGHASDVLSVAISPDGQTLASGSKDRTIKLWNLSTGRLVRTLSGHSDLLRSVNFAPGGQLLASSSWDQTIKIWHLPTGKLLRTLSGHSSYVNAIAISTNQTLASGSDDNTIKLWNLQTGQLLRTLAGHSSHVNSVAFSPDGTILTSGSQDKSVKIWRR